MPKAEFVDSFDKSNGKREFVDSFDAKPKETPSILSGAGISQALTNLPSSIAQQGKDIYSAVRHPVQTAKGIGGLVAEMPEAISGGVAPKWTAVGDMLKDRYGSFENINKTMVEDPAGFLSDLSLFISGGASLAGKVPAIAKTAEKVGQAARLVDPISAIAVGVSKTSKPMNTLAKSALKLPKKRGVERIDTLAQSFMDRGLYVNRKSANVLEADMQKTIGKVNKIVDDATSTGMVIKAENITSSIDNLINNASKEGFTLSDIKIIEDMRDEFTKQHGNILTPREAQNIKMGLNKDWRSGLGEEFGKVRVKVRDTLRNSTMEELEKLHPDLKGLNANWGEAKELRTAINNQIISLESKATVPVKGLIAGGVAGGVTGAIAGATMGPVVGGLTFAGTAFAVERIFDSPKVQISLARALHKINMTRAKVGKLPLRSAFQAGRADRVTSDVTGQEQE